MCYLFVYGFNVYRDWQIACYYVVHEAENFEVATVFF